MHPTLLIGPADWDPAVMPQEEFAARIARLWELWPDARGALIYGDSHDNTALAWLTNFTPKLEPSVALIPREGAPRLMVGGGPNMIPSAKPLTWVAELISLRPTGKTVAQWRESLGGPCICIGIDAMPTRLRRELDAAFAGVAPADEAERLREVMQRRSPREEVCIRGASSVLQRAADAMTEAHRRGEGITAVVLAGEHAAVREQAQDVRTLFSLDGGRSYRPFNGPIDKKADPLTVYIAVRRFGYWVDGYLTLTDGTAVLRPSA
jgi:hypothetical protein